MTLKEETKRHILKMMLLGDAGLRAKYPDLWSDTASIEAVLAADGGAAQAEEADPAKRQKIADLQARKQEVLRVISQTFEKVQSNPRLDNGGDDRVNGVNQLLINLDAFLQDREAYEYYHRMFYEWSLDTDAETMENLIQSVDIDTLRVRALAEQSLAQPAFMMERPMPNTWLQTELDNIPLESDAQPKITGLDGNDVTKTSLAALHMMVTRGRSLEDCYSEKPEMEAERREAGMDFTDFQTDMPAEAGDRRRGRWFRMAGDALMEEKIPDIDYSDRGQIRDAWGSCRRISWSVSSRHTGRLPPIL